LRTIQQILSECQTDINDLAGERIAPAEWLDVLQEVANDVAEKTHSYIGRYVTIPNQGYTDWDAGVSYTQGAVVRYTDGFYYKVWNSTLPPAGTLPTDIGFFVQIVYPPNTVVLPVTDEIYHILRVTRTSADGLLTECREWSYQAIKRVLDDHEPFTNNNSVLTEADFITFMQDETGQQKNITLQFGGEFDTGHIISVEFISNKPFDLTAWRSTGVEGTLTFNLVNDANANASISIPDFLYKAYKWGTLWHSLLKLYFKGDESCKPRADKAEMLYTKYITDASAYIKQPKDLTHGIKIQPLNWLEE